MISMNPGEAYPTQPHDIVAPCPVCGKQVTLERYRGRVYQVLFHNGADGSPCNGTARKAALTDIVRQREV